MFQKVSSALIILSILSSYLLPINTFASDSYYEYTKEALEQTTKGPTYIKSIDTALSKVSDSKLQDIKSRVSTTLDTTVITSENTLLLLEYIEAAVEIEIFNRLGEISISEEDQTIAEKEILIMQNHLGNNISKMMDSLIADWNTLSRYKETGDMTMNLKANMPNILDMKMGVNISNYTNENQSLDSRFQGRINGFIDMMAGGEDISLSGETFADIISKDGAIYGLMQDLQIEGNSVDETLDIYITKLQELSESNTYLSSQDTDLDEIYSLISTFSPTNLEEKIIKMQNTPLLEAYEKVDDSNYILRPTKEFCSYAKELLSVFDPFGGKECSEAQYRDFLQDYYSENPSMILSLGNTSTLSLGIQDDQVEMNMSLSWDNQEMKSMNFNIQSAVFGETEYMTIDWEIGKYFIMNMDIEDMNGKVHMKFSNNGLSTLNANFGYDNPYSDDTMNMLITYKNDTLNIDFTFAEYSTTIDCNISGLLKSDRTNLIGKCTIIGPSIAYLGTGSETIDISSSLTYDGVGNRNNIDMMFSILSGEAFLDMTLQNTGKRSATTQKEILAPENTKDIEEFEDEIFDELYGDLY